MRLSACGRKRGIKGPVCGGSQRSSPGPLPQKGMRFEKGEGFLSQTTAAQENKMGVKPIFGLLLSMALPSMASMLVQALYNIVDGIYVSRIHPDALTAVSLASPVQILMISLSVGTCVGVNSLISRRLGQKNQADADAAATHGLLLSLLSWAACAVFGLLCTNLFFRLFSPSESIFNYGVEYLWVVTVFSAGMFVEISVEKTFQATGSMMTSMVLQLIGAVTNIILDPILIFGLLGAPALGVRGAAIATVIGQSLAGVIGLVLLVRGKNAVTVTLRGFRWNGRIVRDIYTVGLPSILMQSIGSVTAMGFNRILMGLSEGAVWVMGTYSKLENFLFMPLFGLTHGVLPLTGYNFGAKNRERMLQTMRYGLIIGISMMAVGMLIFWIFPRQLLGIFAPTPELMEMGVPALRTISLSFCLGAVGIILSTVFQAVGKGVYSLYISLLRQIVIVLPCAWALSLLGLEYVWFAFPVSNVVSTVLSIVMAKHLFRNYIDPILLDKGEAAR